MTERSLLDRVQRIEDELAIRELCTRYSLAVDDNDFDALLPLFAPDARYGWIDAPEPQAVGRENVVELMRSKIAPSGPSFHVNHDMLIAFTSSTEATGIICCHAEVSIAAGHMIGAIRYRDRYVRADGGWMFAERLLSFLYYTQADAYAGILQQRERLRFVDPPLPAHWPAYAL